MKKFAVVYYNHESVYYVSAEKVLESSSFDVCQKLVDSRSDMYAVVENFEGDQVNAQRVHQYYPESVEF